MNEQEPFEPPFDTDEGLAGTPWAEIESAQPPPGEAPRLSILHLLVLTACVAVYTPHWFGVGTKLWFDVAGLATMAWFLLFSPEGL